MKFLKLTLSELEDTIDEEFHVGGLIVFKVPSHLGQLRNPRLSDLFRIRKRVTKQMLLQRD